MGGNGRQRWGIAAAAAVLGWAAALGLGAAAAHAADVVITAVGGKDSAAGRGVVLGVAEANAQGRYFGRGFAIQYVDPVDPPGAVAGVAIVISPRGGDRSEGGGEAAAGAEGSPPEPPGFWERWGRAADAGWLVLNAVDRGDALRCRDGLFHVIPSRRMLAEALRREGGDAPSPPPPDGLRAQAWHASLFRFAARDLNARYRERFAAPMGPEAWAGWAAARAVGEAVLRTESGDPRRLRGYFREELALDGQKGVALRFAGDGQLWQPVYLVAGDGVRAEFAPPRPGAGPGGDGRGSDAEMGSDRACP